MSRTILVFYGSYRRDRQGIKLARWIVDSLAARGDRAELVDAMAVDLPMLDRRHSDFAAGEAPAAMDALADRIAAPELIWAIVAVAAVSAGVSFGLLPLPPSGATSSAPIRANTLLRQPLFLAIIASAALVQGSHSAYYGFASITWQNAGLGGLSIAMLWSLGVLAEIAVFALSPRFRCSPALLVLIGSAGAMLRWLITAQEPPLGTLVVVQLMHGMSFAMTHLGTVGLMVRCVPHHVLASAQGYLVAAIGIATSAAMILCGAIYEQAGQGIYYLMAAMALAGLLTVMAARPGLDKAGVVAA